MSPRARDMHRDKIPSKPSWYIVATKDHTIQPELERFVAKRMGATMAIWWSYSDPAAAAATA